MNIFTKRKEKKIISAILHSCIEEIYEYILKENLSKQDLIDLSTRIYFDMPTYELNIFEIIYEKLSYFYKDKEAITFILREITQHHDKSYKQFYETLVHRSHPRTNIINKSYFSSYYKYREENQTIDYHTALIAYHILFYNIKPVSFNKFYSIKVEQQYSQKNTHYEFFM